MALANSAENEQAPMFSPDGRWIAYSSTESGAPEIFVQPFPGPGGKWQFSAGGGQYPTWSAGKPELFYQTLDGRVMVVPYTVAGNSLVSDKANAWTERRLALRPGNGPGFAVTADGERIAGAVAAEEPTATEDKVVFVSDFFDELIAAIPTTKR
jgi:serine/threonine-protein kinase